MSRYIIMLTVSVILLLPLHAASRDGIHGGTGIPGQPFPMTGYQVEWINIHGHLKSGQEPQIFPRSQYVDRGNEVLWANGSDTPIRIRFGKGTECSEVNLVEMYSFQWTRIGVSGCIVTATVPPRTVLATFPNEGGTFPFDIEFVGTDKHIKGVLKVF